MIRPPQAQALQVPSLNALRYLRGILFPRSCAQSNYHRRRCHHNTYNPRRALHGEAYEETAVSPPPPPPLINESYWIRKIPSSNDRRRVAVAQERVRQDNFSKAAQEFLQAVPVTETTVAAAAKEGRMNKKKDTIAIDEDEFRRCAIELMKFFNKSNRFSETPKIFQHLLSYSPGDLDIRAFNLCLRAHLERGRHEKFISIFNHHDRWGLKPNHLTYDLVIRNFVKLKQLDKAEEVIRSRLDTRKLVLPHSFAVLMEGIKKSGGSLKMLEGILEWMVQANVKPHVAIYNILIKAALDEGNREVAEEYTREMSAKGLVNASTFGIFLLDQARAGDWEGFENILKRMREQKIKLNVGVFNAILNQYSAVALLGDLEAFFAELIKQNMLKPTRMSFNIMVKAVLRAGSETGLVKWISRMRGAGLTVNVVTFNTIFANFCYRGNAPPYLLRRIYRAILEYDSSLVNSVTKDILLHGTHRIRRKPQRTSLRAILYGDENEEQASTDLYMQSAIDEGRPYNPIAVLDEVLSHSSLPSMRLTIHAVYASFALKDKDLSFAINLLQTAENRGVRVNLAVLSTIIQSCRIASQPSSERVMQRVRDAYEFMEANFIPISHHVCVTAAYNLIVCGGAEAAIFIINQVSRTRWGQELPLDIAGLTVLLSAYSILRDMEGITWVVENLIRTRVTPDPKFFMYLKRAKSFFLAAGPPGGKKKRKEDDDAEVAVAVLEELTRRCRAHEEAMVFEAERKGRLVLRVIMGPKKSEDVYKEMEEYEAYLRMADTTTAAAAAESAAAGGRLDRLTAIITTTTTTTTTRSWEKHKHFL